MKIKSRTNQPCTYVLEETKNINELSDEFIDNLKCGDIVQKITGEQKHAYIVSYKQEKHGICLTYVASGYSETISYDYTAGHWVFNSKDVASIYDDVTIDGDLTLGSEEEPADLSVSGDAVIAGDARVEGDLVIEGGVSISEGLLANTIKPLDANYSHTFSLTPENNDNDEFELVGVPFAKFEVVGGILYIIYSALWHNTTAGQRGFRFAINNLVIPSDIGQYIYDVMGKNLTEAVSGDGRILDTEIFKGDAQQTLRISHTDENKMMLYDTSAVTVNADANIHVTFRTFLTIV